MNATSILDRSVDDASQQETVPSRAGTVPRKKRKKYAPRSQPGECGNVTITVRAGGTVRASARLRMWDGTMVFVDASAPDEREARRRLAIHVEDRLAGRTPTRFPGATGRISNTGYGTVRVTATANGAMARTSAKRPDGRRALVSATGATEQEARERLMIRIGDVLSGRPRTAFRATHVRQRNARERLPATTQQRKSRVSPGTHGSVDTVVTSAGTWRAQTVARRLDGSTVAVSATGATEQEARERLMIRVGDVLSGRPQTAFSRKGFTWILPGTHGVVTVQSTLAGSISVKTKARRLDGSTVAVSATGPTEQEARERLNIRIDDVLAGRPPTAFSHKGFVRIVPGTHGVVTVQSTPAGSVKVQAKVRRLDGSTVAVNATSATEQEARERLDARIDDVFMGREPRRFPPTLKTHIAPGQHGAIWMLRRMSSGYAASTKVRPFTGEIVPVAATGPTEQEARKRLMIRVGDVLDGRPRTAFSRQRSTRILPGTHGFVAVQATPAGSILVQTRVRRLDGSTVAVSATGPTEQEARERLMIRVGDVLDGRPRTAFSRQRSTRILPGTHGVVTVQATPAGSVTVQAKARRLDGLTVIVNATGATEREARERLNIRIDDVLAGKPQTSFSRQRSTRILPGTHGVVTVHATPVGSILTKAKVRRLDGSTVIVNATGPTEQEARERLMVRIDDALAGRVPTAFPQARSSWILPGTHGVVTARATPAGSISVQAKARRLDGLTVIVNATGATEREARERLNIRIDDVLAGKPQTSFSRKRSV